MAQEWLEWTTKQGFTPDLEKSDLKRPWGGFFSISDKKKFLQTYFDENSTVLKLPLERIACKLLFVNAGKQTSWQYHDRREEFWMVIQGTAWITQGTSDKEPTPYGLTPKCQSHHPRLTRHRLTAGVEPVIVAEVWFSPGEGALSTEEDITRVG